MQIHIARGSLALLALFAALPYPEPARAADPASGSHSVRVDLAIFAGFQNSKMSDVNDVVAATDLVILEDPVASASGLWLTEIKGGTSLGSGIRVWPKENIVIAADYTYLKNSTDDNATFNPTPGSPKLKAQVAAPAHSVGLTVGYFFLKPARWARIGAGIGGAYYICDGKVGLTFPWYRQSLEMHGTGLGGHGMVLGDIRLSDRIHLEAAVGYRAAKTRDLRSQEGVLTFEDGSKLKADYTGVFSRLGLDIPFGPR